MKPVRAHFRLRFYGDLPDDDGEADDAFNEWETRILALLNRQQFGAGIVAESFTVEDGDTEPDV